MKDCKGRECNLGKDCFKNDPAAETCTCGFVGDRELRTRVVQLELEIKAAVAYLESVGTEKFLEESDPEYQMLRSFRSVLKGPAEDSNYSAHDLAVKRADYNFEMFQKSQRRVGELLAREAQLGEALNLAKKGLSDCAKDSERNFGCRGCLKDLKRVEAVLARTALDGRDEKGKGV